MAPRRSHYPNRAPSSVLYDSSAGETEYLSEGATDEFVLPLRPSASLEDYLKIDARSRKHNVKSADQNLRSESSRQSRQNHAQQPISTSSAMRPVANMFRPQTAVAPVNASLVAYDTGLTSPNDADTSNQTSPADTNLNADRGKSLGAQEGLLYPQKNQDGSVTVLRWTATASSSDWIPLARVPSRDASSFLTVFEQLKAFCTLSIGMLDSERFEKSIAEILRSYPNGVPSAAPETTSSQSPQSSARMQQEVLPGFERSLAGLQQHTTEERRAIAQQRGQFSNPGLRTNAESLSHNSFDLARRTGTISNLATQSKSPEGGLFKQDPLRRTVLRDPFQVSREEPAQTPQLQVRDEAGQSALLQILLTPETRQEEAGMDMQEGLALDAPFDESQMLAHEELRLRDTSSHCCNPYGPFFTRDANNSDAAQKSYEDRLNDWWDQPKREIAAFNKRADVYLAGASVAPNDPAWGRTRTMLLLHDRLSVYNRDKAAETYDYLMPWTKPKVDKEKKMFIRTTSPTCVPSLPCGLPKVSKMTIKSDSQQ